MFLRADVLRATRGQSCLNWPHTSVENQTTANCRQHYTKCDLAMTIKCFTAMFGLKLVCGWIWFGQLQLAELELAWAGVSPQE